MVWYAKFKDISATVVWTNIKLPFARSLILILITNLYSILLWSVYLKYKISIQLDIQVILILYYALINSNIVH